jgi:hypothetical protein
MNKNHEKRIPFIVIVLLGLIHVILFYGNVLNSPNDFMFSSTGDGTKNYFTFAYHIKHDSTYTNFEGMNYPYGENYLYTDCHPLISNVFKYLSSKDPVFETHSIGLLNLLMILSILLTFLIIYFLLIELELNAWLSVILSFCITLLAPQLFRLEGHFALSYSIAIPLSWFLVIKCVQKLKWHLYLLLFTNCLFWMLIHAYLGIIVISFLFSFALIHYFYNQLRKENIFQYILLGLAIVIPVILFYIYVALIDTHAGRTNNPSGFFLYNAELDDILFPSEKPFRPILDNVTGGIIRLQWEARGYLGIFNSFFLIALVLISIISIFNKKLRSNLKSLFENRILTISLLAAFIVLLFAFAIPFKQIPDLIDVVPILKQFRATGRFVWPFYFVFTVFAASIFNKKIQALLNNKTKIITVGLIVLYASIYCFEGYYYHYPISKRISKMSNLFDKEQLSDDFKTAIELINPEDFQAIISFPFYYQGSESYSRPRQDEAVNNSLVLSYHTGIPNICTNLTRTSIEESKRIVQVVSPNYYLKKIINDFKSKKPFLLLKTGNSFSKYETEILKKGETIYINDSFELLKIDFDKLFSDDRHQKIIEYQADSINLIKQDSFYVSQFSSLLYYDSFEKSKSDTSYRGIGSYVSMKKGKNTFAEFSPNTFQIGKEYDLSIWMFNEVQDALNLWFRLIVEEYDERNNQWYQTVFYPDNAEVINNNWSLIEGTFSVHDSKNRIFIVSKGKEDSKATLHVDDLLIKDKGTNVYRIDKENNSLFYNNHKIDMR